MLVNKEQLIEALYNEYSFLCHDDFDPDENLTPEQYFEMIKILSYEELVEEASIDENFTLEEYMEVWG